MKILISSMIWGVILAYIAGVVFSNMHSALYNLVVVLCFIIITGFSVIIQLLNDIRKKLIELGHVDKTELGHVDKSDPS